MSDFINRLDTMPLERRHYTLGALPRHLFETRQEERLKHILTMFDFLKVKLDKFGHQSLIDDYDGTTQHELHLLQRTLRLSANVLSEDRTQLAGQLIGRLLPFDLPGIQNLVSQAKEYNATPTLLPLVPMLTPPTGNLLQILTGHSSAVSTAVMTPDGQFLITGSWDTTIKIWNFTTGQVIRTIEGHDSYISSITLTTDGKYIISGSWDQTVRVWDRESGDKIHHFIGHTGYVNAVATTPNGRYAISGSDDSTLRVWDLVDGQKEFVLTGHNGSVQALAVTPDGQYIVSSADDNTIKIWGIVSRKTVRTMRTHEQEGMASIRIIAPEYALAIQSDGRYLISVAHNLKKWDMSSGELVFETEKGWAMHSLAITPNNVYAVVGVYDNTVKVFHLSTGALVHLFKGHSDHINAVAITPDGRYILSGSADKTLRIWNLESDISNNKLDELGHNDQVNAITITPNGRYALSGAGKSQNSADNTLKILDLFTLKAIPTLSEHSGPILALTTTPDSCFAISGSYDGTLKIWEIWGGKCVATLIGHTKPVQDVAVTPDGQRIVSVAADDTFRVWHIASGTLLYIHSIHRGQSYSMPGHGIAITPDGKYVVSEAADGEIQMWNITNGYVIRTFQTNGSGVAHIRVTPDGQYLVAGTTDYGLEVWNLKTGEKLYEMMNDYINGIEALALTSDGRFIISASSFQNTVKVWNLKTGVQLYVLSSHKDWVNGVAVTPNGRYAVSVSKDTMLKVWDLKSGSQVATFNCENPLKVCAIAPDGITIVAGEMSGRVDILRFVAFH